jgi:mRNA interferase HigB
VRIIALSTLTAYAKKFPDSAKAISAWYAVASTVTWRNAAEVENAYGNASIINADRVVFNIAGNKYRLVVSANYRSAIMFIKFLGTHAEYDLIDAATIEYRDLK